ncbi:hypothetical protein [Sphingobacterium siyangense]|uniref:hypothetical protein n=1 Tax=Sphingobacterium siyangense TaxID=459529 RepID=UPI0019639F1B|nr:hypothetical protein [Sphingobacterium siyangense]QRY56334.1 hypothetical protein JVX97_20260 [Sphingobacterium siyangense]
MDFSNELAWAKTIIDRQKKYLGEFVILSNRFSKLLYYGEYKVCGEILDSIERKYGYSLWSIKNRIALIQIVDGLEEQKKFTLRIKNKLRNGSLPKFIIHWASVRNENKTSSARFEQQLHQYISKIDSVKYQGYQDYLRYHLLGEINFPIESFGDLLRLSFSSSLIDLYQAFTSFLYYNVSSENITRQISQILNSLSPIDPGIRFLENFVLDINTDIEDAKIRFCSRILEEKECNDNLLESLDELSLLPTDDLLFRSLVSQEKIHVENNILKDKITGLLSVMLKQGYDKSKNEVDELSKIILNFRDCNWTSVISVLLDGERVLNESTCNAIDLLKINSIHPFYLDLDTKSKLGEKIRSYFVSQLSRLYATSKSLLYYKSLSENFVHIDFNLVGINYSKLALMKIAFNLSNYESVIEIGKTLLLSEVEYFQRRAYSFISEAYFNLGNFETLLKVLCEVLLSSKVYLSYLPITKFCKELSKQSKTWESVRKYIELPILLDFEVRFSDRAWENSRRFAYEDFLEFYNLSKPSEIRGLNHNFEKPKVIYFLNNVCQESVIETSIHLSSSKDVLSERLEICRLLIEIDPENENDYKLEVRDLLRRQVISERREEVDSSRIYIDIQNVKQWSKKELSESCIRYLSYLKIRPANLNSLPVISEVGNETFSNVNMILPEDEMTGLFIYVFEEIRKKYLSVDMGLDRFISTRIRHGELERTMRIPIQNQNLITKRETESGPYSSNKFWINKLKSSTNRDTLNKIDIHLKTFSRRYDNLIFSTANEYLQIRKSSKRNGLFDFNFSRDELESIIDKITIDTGVESFINLIITALEHKLIYNLIYIREFIDNEFKTEAKSLITLLGEDIAQCSNMNQELDRAIHVARTDVSFQTDRVIEWFVTPTSGESAPFLIPDAIAVAEEIIKESKLAFEVEMEDFQVDFAIHGNLPIFVDIFINIFENIVKRSGLDNPKAIIEFEQRSLNDELVYIKINVKNKVSSDKNLEEIRKDLANKKSLLDSGNYDAYLATEGNSGLFKIHKSVTDFKSKEFVAKMDFGLREDEFQINVEIPFNIIRVID